MQRCRNRVRPPSTCACGCQPVDASERAALADTGAGGFHLNAKAAICPNRLQHAVCSVVGFTRQRVVACSSKQQHEDAPNTAMSGTVVQASKLSTRATLTPVHPCYPMSGGVPCTNSSRRGALEPECRCRSALILTPQSAGHRAPMRQQVTISRLTNVCIQMGNCTRAAYSQMPPRSSVTQMQARR